MIFLYDVSSMYLVKIFPSKFIKNNLYIHFYPNDSFISVLKLELTFACSVKEGIHFIFFFKLVVGCIEFCFVCLFIYHNASFSPLF